MRITEKEFESISKTFNEWKRCGFVGLLEGDKVDYDFQLMAELYTLYSKLNDVFALDTRGMVWQKAAELKSIAKNRLNKINE